MADRPVSTTALVVMLGAVVFSFGVGSPAPAIGGLCGLALGELLRARRRLRG
jgi:hypothetical protein